MFLYPINYFSGAGLLYNFITMNIKTLSFLGAVVATCAAHAGAVRMGEDKIVLPT